MTRRLALTYDRDLIGYGANPPDPKWPGGARVAINFVMNYEEGSEPSVQDGEGYTEIGLTESSGLPAGVKASAVTCARLLIESCLATFTPIASSRKTPFGSS